MQIPINQSLPKRPPLELISIKLYSTGLKKVYTNHFYKSMNYNFGVKIVIKNNTPKPQMVKIGGCIHDENGNLIIKWNPTNTEIAPNNSIKPQFLVKENDFSKMKIGKYTILFWINDKKVQNKYFTVTYK